jgi:hypothetical protein
LGSGAQWIAYFLPDVIRRSERYLLLMQTINCEGDAAPSWPSQETSANAILERADAKRLPPEEFGKHFGNLPTDGEG